MIQFFNLRTWINNAKFETKNSAKTVFSESEEKLAQKLFWRIRGKN